MTTAPLALFDPAVGEVATDCYRSRLGRIACLVGDLSELGQPVVAGFSTHPHWDHLLWHADLGGAARYGTARCPATIQARLADRISGIS